MGYLAGKGSSKLAKVKVNLPLLLAASVLPDVDLLLRFLTHRGLTHSLIIITALMIPFFVVYRKQAIPYYAALLSHILIGDFFTGGIQLFWPLSQTKFGILNLNVSSCADVTVELALFLVTLPIMYKLGDLQTLLKPHNKNWVLVIPFVAVLGPMLSLVKNSMITPLSLLFVPSLFYLGLFAFSILVDLRSTLNKTECKLDSGNTSLTSSAKLLCNENRKDKRASVVSTLIGLRVLGLLCRGFRFAQFSLRRHRTVYRWFRVLTQSS